MMPAMMLGLGLLAAIFASAMVAGTSMHMAMESGCRPRFRLISVVVAVAGCAGALASGVALGGMLVR